MWRSGRGKWIIATSLVALIALTADAKANVDIDCERGEPEVGIPACTAIMAQANRTPERVAAAHYNRGRYYTKLKKYKLAISDFNKALAWNPKDHEAHVGVGGNYLNLGDLKRSIASFNNAIKAKPDFLGGYIGRAHVYLMQKKDREAIRDYQTMLSLDPTNKFAAEQLRNLGQ